MLGELLRTGLSFLGQSRQADALQQGVEDLDAALDVQGIADRLGFSLDDVFGTRLEPPEFDFQFDFDRDDILDFAKQVPFFNMREGVRYANRGARRINRTTLNQLERGMRQLFGGGEAFERMRDLTNQNITDQLEGRLSESTRQGLARRAISAGASAIGPGAVDDNYAAYLGLTTEDIVSRGMEQYRSMYQTYRQSFPMVTGAQLLPYTTLPTSTGTQIALTEASQRNQLGFQTSIAEYEAALNQALALAAPDPVASGLTQAEIQRGAAVAGAQLQASSAQGGAISNLGQSLGGLFQGNAVAQAPLGTYSQVQPVGGGAFGGTLSRI